ncbi:MAG: DUF3604 domain-containing protein [Halioglobus sp.]|nr:DUF3604 domain-containing protein [Halioglobus sp.]
MKYFSCLCRKGLFAGILTLLAPASQSLEYTESRRTCISHNVLRQPFFGDLHVHTRYSLDASTQGTRTTPSQAYGFARGEVLGIQPWTDDGKPLRRVQIPRPLDFAMVADHAELFGEVHICNTLGVEGHDSWECILYRHWPQGAYYLFNFMSSMHAAHLSLCGEQDRVCKSASAVPWLDLQLAAEAYYDRTENCSFTTFVGYEWTGMDADTGGNLHRNVIFRNAEVPVLPITFIDKSDVESLWRELDTQCTEKEGTCDALAIPHNSNLSAGVMFPENKSISVDYARLRHRYEPLLEIMQKGGASECYFKAGISQDELCAFEQRPIDNLAGFNNPPGPDTGFARRILLSGMAVEARLGSNPYQLGFIGSTDTHLGTSGAVEEWNFLGHGGKGVPATDRIPAGLPDLLINNPGGLAVVWAEENSRDALFDALRRRETYATSGTRIVSRFFAGWHFPDNLCALPDRLERAYTDGVPMGGDLPPARQRQPTFLLLARQDPGTKTYPGTPLQRIQIIKGWLSEAGEFREKVLDVVSSASPALSADSATCEAPAVGASELCVVWRDSQFDPNERSYYYSRVLEMPTCRWSQRICLERGVDCNIPETVGKGLEACCSDDHRRVIQERAWSSPIWYRPTLQVKQTAG